MQVVSAFLCSGEFWKGVGYSCGPSQIVGTLGLCYSVPMAAYHTYEWIIASNTVSGMAVDHALFQKYSQKKIHHEKETYKYLRFTRAFAKALTPLAGTIWVAMTETKPGGAFPPRSKPKTDDADGASLIAVGSGNRAVAVISA